MAWVRGRGEWAALVLPGGHVWWRINGTGDFEIVPVGGGPTQVCLVPRPPK